MFIQEKHLTWFVPHRCCALPLCRLIAELLADGFNLIHGSSRALKACLGRVFSPHFRPWRPVQHLIYSWSWELKWAWAWWRRWNGNPLTCLRCFAASCDTLSSKICESIQCFIMVYMCACMRVAMETLLSEQLVPWYEAYHDFSL